MVNLLLNSKLNSSRALRFALVTLSALPLLAYAQSTSAPGQLKAEVTPEVYHDHSASLRGIMHLSGMV